MPSSDQVRTICDAYRFGPFEVRVSEEVLLQRGRRVRIQDLPFKMLLALLEHPGELVSKELLQDRLWGQETFVEVDKSLYVVAAKLREALGDDATEPRFVRTVSGRGYRFIAKVDTVIDPPPSAMLEPIAVNPPIQEEQKQDSPRPTSLKFPPRSAVALALAAFLLLCTCILLVVYRRYNRPLVGEKNVIVVGGFANATGNPDLENALSSVFRLKLQESPYLNLIPDLQFRRFVSDPDSATAQDQVHACAALDGQVLLNGQLNALAQGYRILLMVSRCSDGKLLATETADANSQSALLTALDTAVVRLRRRLGESKKSVDEFNVPSNQATTSSIAALKAFSLGEEKRWQGLKQDALTAYKLAIDLDPQFAIAYARLGTVYTNLGEPALNRQYYKRAFDLRDRTTDRERLYIITHYYADALGDTKRAIEDYELWHTLYPRDLVPANNLAIQYLVIGEPEKAVDLVQAAVRLDPHYHFSYATLAQAYMKTGDYSDLQSLCEDPNHNDTDIVGFHVACFEGAFAQDDEPGMQRQMQWAKGKPEESKLLEEAASVAVYRGKLSEAWRLFSQAKQAALSGNFVLSAANVQLDRATVEAELDFKQQARTDALDGLRLAAGDPAEEALAAVILARAGDIPSAESNIKDAENKTPSDTLLNSALLPLARALIQLQQHNPKAAVQSLEETRPLDFCDPTDLAPAYVRGVAYLEQGNTQSAAKEFQRVIDHRAIVPSSLYVVLSRLELGHTYLLTGENKKAQEIFDDLTRIWKNADPDFPPLVRLRAYETARHSQIN